MLKALLRIQFLSLAGYMFKGRHRTKKRSPLVTALIALLAVYIVAVICLYFGMLFISICEPFYSMGLGWLYFSFAGLTAFAGCFITGIFIAQSQLFDAKDNELLLSLPIPPKYILASRILTLLLLNYALTFAAAVPCAVVSFMTVKVTFTGALNFIFAFLLLPLPAAALTCLAGWLIAEISSRMKHKNLVSVVISVALLLAYMAVMMRMQGLLAGLAANGAMIGETVKSIFPPLYHFGAAIANRDAASLLIFTLWALVPFAAVYFVL